MAGGMQVASLFAVLDLKDNLSAGLDAAGEKIGGFGGKLKTGLAVGAGAAAVGFVGLAAGAGVAVKAAMEAETNYAKLEQVIAASGGAAGLNADEVAGMASELSKVTRFSDDAIISGQTMLLTFHNIGADEFPRATAAMTDMGEMFGSIDQASIQLGKALNDPVAGVAALSRIGLQFSEDQKDIIAGMMEVNNLAGAQDVILTELESQFGGVAVAAGDTLEGKMAILKNRFDEMAEGIGTALIPLITEFVDLLTADVLPAIEDVAGKVATFVTDLVAAFEEGGFEEAGTFLLEGIAEGLSDIGTWAKEKVVDPAVYEIKMWFVSGQARADLENAGKKILEGIAEAFTAIATWALDEVVSPLAKEVFNAMTNPDTYVELANAGGEILAGIASGLGDIAGWVWDEIVEPILNGVSGLAGKVKDAIMGHETREEFTESGGRDAASRNAYNVFQQTRDVGGRGSRGMAYLIGTGAQPEMFVPDSAGTFYPRNQYALAGAGGPIVVQLQLDRQTIYEAVVNEGRRRNEGWG
jgi:hypothetical protein